MTSVELDIPKQFRSPLTMNAIVIELIPCEDRTVLPTPVSFIANSSPPFHDTKKSFVVRGVLTNADGTQVDAVCKLVWGPDARKRLKHEADLYLNELYFLQGLDIPKYYGICTSTYDEHVVSCMFLEYCGEAPKGSVLHNRKMW